MVFLQLIKIFILLNGIYNYDLLPEKYKLKNGRLVKDGIYVGPRPENVCTCIGGGTLIPELRKNKNMIFEIMITLMNKILIIYTQF